MVSGPRKITSTNVSLQRVSADHKAFSLEVRDSLFIPVHKAASWQGRVSLEAPVGSEKVDGIRGGFFDVEEKLEVVPPSRLEPDVVRGKAVALPKRFSVRCRRRVDRKAAGFLKRMKKPFEGMCPTRRGMKKASGYFFDCYDVGSREEMKALLDHLDSAGDEVLGATIQMRIGDRKRTVDLRLLSDELREFLLPSITASLTKEKALKLEEKALGELVELKRLKGEVDGAAEQQDLIKVIKKYKRVLDKQIAFNDEYVDALDAYINAVDLARAQYDMPIEGTESNQQAFIAYGVEVEGHWDALEKMPALWAGETAIAQEVGEGLVYQEPKLATTGTSGTFFMKDRQGKVIAVYKPREMEPGMPLNPHLKGKRNRVLRKGIKAGDGAAREVMGFVMDEKAFGGHYGLPETRFATLHDVRFGGDSIGSVQRFIPDMCPLYDLTQEEMKGISKGEVDRLSWHLIVGNTDAHLGNIGYNRISEEIGLYDNGLCFIGDGHQKQYRNPWILLQGAKTPMSASEYAFLNGIDVEKSMGVFAEQALLGKELNSAFTFSAAEYLAQKFRLIIAKNVGKHKLTQLEWGILLGSDRTQYIYKVFAGKFDKQETSFKMADGKVHWDYLSQDIEDAVIAAIRRRV